MANTRSQDLASQLVALQGELAALKLEKEEQATQLVALRERTPPVDSPHPEEERQRPNRQVGLSDPPAVLVTSHLKHPNIDKFSGDREKAEDFVLAIDSRLKAAGQIDTFNGLEFAVGHLQGWAATWYRCWSQENPVVSWAELRAPFTIQFKMVEEARVFEQRLMGCKHTGDLTEFCEEFLRLSSRLRGLPDDFKQRVFARGCNSYLRDTLADKEHSSLLETVQYVMGLIPKVEPHLLLPDSSGSALVAAMPARRSSTARQFTGTCFACGGKGHKQAECRTNPVTAGSAKAGANATRGKAKMGQYKGTDKRKTGRINAVEAMSDEDLSDDELRQGNDEA